MTLVNKYDLKPNITKLAKKKWIFFHNNSINIILIKNKKMIIYIKKN